MCSRRSASSWGLRAPSTRSGFGTGGMRVARAEPERELVRRVSPVALPIAGAAFAIGALIGGSMVGWSAAIAIVIVYVNFVANAFSISWAASVSPTLVSIVAIGGYAVRLIVYTVVL